MLDLRRVPEARLPRPRPWRWGTARLTRRRTFEATVAQGWDAFGADNRAGIERTLHRISAIRNRRGDVVGPHLSESAAPCTARWRMVRDLLDSAQSLLLMGRPGVGKTTASAGDHARVPADELHKAQWSSPTPPTRSPGTATSPHPAIGRATPHAGGPARAPAPGDDRGGREPHARGHRSSTRSARSWSAGRPNDRGHGE